MHCCIIVFLIVFQEKRVVRTRSGGVQMRTSEPTCVSTAQRSCMWTSLCLTPPSLSGGTECSLTPSSLTVRSYPRALCVLFPCRVLHPVMSPVQPCTSRTSYSVEVHSLCDLFRFKSVQSLVFHFCVCLILSPLWDSGVNQENRLSEGQCKQCEAI